LTAYSDEDRTGLSARTFLTLGIASGPNRACLASRRQSVAGNAQAAPEGDVRDQYCWIRRRFTRARRFPLGARRLYLLARPEVIRRWLSRSDKGSHASRS
jgi:hypothetical protein